MGTLTHSADLESTTAGLERLWSGEIAHLDVEKRYLRKSGGALWVHATISLVSGGGPEPECSVEFLLDISARKQMAAALLQNQTLLATVIAELPIALVACDVRGQVTHHNLAAAELLGISAEETDHAVPRNPYPSPPKSIWRMAQRRFRVRIVRWREPCSVTRCMTPSSSSSGRTVYAAPCCRARSAWSARPASHSVLSR